MAYKTHLKRKMETRHIRMISLGGVIGTGLFLSSGYTIHEAGPLGTVIAYLVGALIVFAVMLCLGELSVAMPYTGAFHVYAKKYIGPSTGFVVAIIYWLTWTIALGSEFTAAGLIMQKWFPNGFSGVFTTMLTVNFAFSGTELIGITAGEAEDPQKAIPSAIKTTLWRLVIFFIGSIVVMATLIPYKVAGVTQSPFVYVLDLIHVPFAANIMNFVVLTAIISAANSGLYASTRMLWSLSNEGTIPKVFQKTGKNGVPTLALGVSMLGGIFALISSKVAASTVYLVLVSISGLAVVIVWMAIAWAELNFRKQFLKDGHHLSELKYRTPWYPVVPYFAFFASLFSCILIWFDPTQRVALYYTIPFVAICYLVQYLWRKFDKNLRLAEEGK